MFNSIPRPEYSRRKVKRAGKILANVISEEQSSNPEVIEAFKVFRNWRLSHAYPLVLCRNDLRKYLREADISADIPTRIKRNETIRRKLTGARPFSLDKIQDLGGLRVVLPSMSEVDKITAIYLSRNTRYEIRRSKDYILNPKSDGYRSRHIVLRHPLGVGTNRDAHAGQTIELQIRTKLQHVWATASEGLGFHLGVSFKHGEGDERWHRLFAHMSELFTIQDGLDGRNRHDIAKDIQKLNTDLDALKFLIKAKNSSLTLPEFSYDSWVVLNYEKDKEEPTSFKLFDNFGNAEKHLRAIEGGLWTTNAVLLGVSPYFALRDAYPNYFADMGTFTKILSEIVEGRRHSSNIQTFNETAAGIALADAVKDGVFRNLRRRRQ